MDLLRDPEIKQYVGAFLLAGLAMVLIWVGLDLFACVWVLVVRILVEIKEIDKNTSKFLERE